MVPLWVCRGRFAVGDIKSEKEKGCRNQRVGEPWISRNCKVGKYRNEGRKK